MGFGDKNSGQHTWTLDEEQSRLIIKYALDAGINFFDTAMAYQNGSSETYLGRALRDFVKREDVVIATKFIPRSQQEIQAGINGQQHVANMLTGSLRRLGTEYIDLYIYHMWDYHTPIENIMEGLHTAVSSGRVRAIGISNCFAWQLAKANVLAEVRGWTKFVSVQGHYNLIFREEEREMVPYCMAENIALTPYSSLAGGRLSRLPGEVTKRLVEDSYAKGKYDRTAEQDAIIIERVAKIAQNKNASMSAVALAWLLSKVTAPIVGATKVHHIDSAVEAVNLELTRNEIAYLEEPYRPHELVGVMASNR